MANDTTPLLLITNVGLTAANNANPQGPWIHITKFEIGSAYGYTPDVNQTQLQGNLLYSGTPTDYRYIGNNTTNIICIIPPEAGPWEFGEVALFAQDMTGATYLFAIAVFASPQTKFSSLGTNVVSSYTLNCLIKLQQSVAIFQIDTSPTTPYVADIYQWSDVYPPSLSANPDVPLYNIREPSSRGEGSLLLTTNDNHRSFVEGAYEQIWPLPNGSGDFIVQNASSTFVDLTKAQVSAARINVLAVQFNRDLLIQTHAGFWRSVNSVQSVGNNYRFNLNCTNDGTYNNYPLPVVPQNGETCYLYADYLSGRQILYSQIIDPPSIPPAQPGIPGLATAGHGLNVDSPGVLGAYGLLHQPSASTGRFLTGSDDLNNIGLDSGLYTCYWNGPNGNPANTPAAQGAPGTQTSFHLMQICPERGQGTGGGSITQLWMPLGQGDGGPPIYWRQCGSGIWGAWYAFNVKNKSGSTGGYQVFFAQTNISNSATWTGASSPIGGLPALTGPGIFHSWLIDDSANTTNVYRNGQNVSANTKNGGAGYGRRHHDFAMFLPGDTIQMTVSDNPVVAIQMMLFQ